MKRQQLGRTGCAVSAVGLGTVKFGRNTALDYAAAFALPDDRALSTLLVCASELGINLLDTAPAYGNAEQRLGLLLRGQRQQWVISSKCGEEFDGINSTFDFSPQHTRLSVERSLRRLQTDYLDIVLLHSNGDDLHIIQESGAMDELERLRDAGMVRAIGISSKTVAGGIAAAARCDVVMVSYSLDYQEQRPVLDACMKSGCGVLIKKALGSGRLCAADAPGLQQSFAAVYAHPAVSAVLVGTIQPAHLRQNVAAVASSGAGLFSPRPLAGEG